MTITAFPLSWPTGWKRTPADARTPGRFGVAKTTPGGYKSHSSELSVSQATTRLFNELARLGAPHADIILSTNLVLRLDGLPRSGQAAPGDPGAAVYWRDPYNGQPRSMAIDQYTRVEQNIAALAATIEAMRAIERHGGAVVMERAFTGFAALPAPGAARAWWEVLGVAQSATAEEIKAAHRSLASKHHPDRGGTAEQMAAINKARDEALRNL